MCFLNLSSNNHELSTVCRNWFNFQTNNKHSVTFLCCFYFLLATFGEDPEHFSIIFCWVFTLSFVFFSTPGATTILHSTYRQWDHARRQCQYHMCGSGFSHAICQVDAGCWGPYTRGRHAHWAERLRAYRRPPVSQLHLCGYVNPGGDRGCGTDNSER